MATDETVIKTPGTVLLQPRISITLECHSRFVKLNPPIATPHASPNQRSVNKIAGAINPRIPKTIITCFAVKVSPLRPLPNPESLLPCASLHVVIDNQL
jgi:hypothetical protein